MTLLDAPQIAGLRTYPVQATARAPLVEFMTSALKSAGCTILHASTPGRAPFIVVFKTPTGERMGIVAYAFRATRTPTKNRPADERSFQIKYGNKADYADHNVHDLWQDPMGLFTTMLVGIDPTEGICIAADPVVHSPTKFFIRLEFKDHHAEAILQKGWHAWERIKRRPTNHEINVETLIGVTKDRFLDLVRFERAARDANPGNRLILAEGHALALPKSPGSRGGPTSKLIEAIRVAHPLAQQFGLSSDEILDLIESARRLKMATRGWVAEEHLRRTLSTVPGVTSCKRLDDEGGPDLAIEYRYGPPLTVECKNVARQTDKHGNPKVDFQRTRASKGDPCSRYYQPTDFDIVAACLHAVSAQWDFRFVLPRILAPHKSCPGRITSNVRVDDHWLADAEAVFRRVYADKGVSV